MEDGKFEPICIGDYITLYADEQKGYIFSYLSSKSQRELSVAKEQSPDFPVIPNVQAVVFELCVQNRYKLSKKLLELAAEAAESPDDIACQTSLAQKAAGGEARDNAAEQRRQAGRRLLYGQSIQLRHTFTRKYLHVNPVHTSYTESNNMMVELLAENAKTCLWKILPRYKVKSEGEIVQSGDQIVLESIKSSGNFLHVSRSLLGKGFVTNDWFSYEVNLSISSSRLTIRMFRRPKNGKSKGEATGILKGGDVVRLFHREVEAYLALEGLEKDDGLAEELHLRVRRQDQSRPKTLYPPTSAIVYWQIEKERGILDGEPVHWDDYVRLRHFIRRQYLCRDSGGRLALCDDPEDPATLFALQPVLKTEERVSADSPVRIQHATSGAWVHGFVDKPLEGRHNDGGGHAGLPWTTAEKRRLSLEADVHHEDAFSLQIVSDRDVTDANVVAGTVPLFRALGEALRSRPVPSSRQLRRLESGVLELGAWTKLDGEFCKRRQKLLRNFQVVDMAVELLRFRKAESGGRLEGAFGALISLLSAYLSGDSRKNELYMGRHMDFFIRQIGDASGSIGLTATLMTVELLRNNRTLVDRITTAHIDKICTLVKQTTNFRYLDLLSALCVCDGTALSRNQDYILQELFIKPRHRGQSVFLRTSLGQAIGRRQNVAYVSWDQGASWLTLHDFARHHHDSPVFAFFREQLLLFANISSGRNSSAVTVMTGPGGCLAWEEAYACLTDEKLDDELRAIYARLLYDLFINVGANFTAAGQRLVFPFAEVPTPERQREMGLDQSHARPLQLPFMEPLKLWLTAFLEENDSMVASQVGRNQLIAQVLVLIRRLALLGYYDDIREVKAMLDSILGLLEGSDDLPLPIRGDLLRESEDVQALVAAYRAEGRFKKNVQNTAMAAVKIGACEATELMFNLRSESRIARFISEFKAIVGDKTHILHAMLRPDFDLSDTLIGEKALRLLSQLLVDSDYIGKEMIDVCLDLSRYEYELVVSGATSLIHRFHASHSELFSQAASAQVLLSGRSVETDGVLASSLRGARLLLADKRIDRDNGRRLIALLDDLAALCFLEADAFNDAHPIHQQLIANHHLLPDLFDIITGQILTEPDVCQKTCYRTAFHQSIQTLAEMMESCVSLLMGLAHQNPSIQGQLFERLGDFLRCDAVSAYLADFFGRIFTGNRALCLRVSNATVREMVALVARNGSPSFLSLLSKLVLCDGEPLKRNQSLILKALLQYKQCIEMVTESSSDQRLKILRASENNSQALEKKNYFAGVVQLLAHCSQGDNKAVESICQSIFTLDELVQILCLPEICNGLRAPFLQFLFGVFFTSSAAGEESGLAELGRHPGIWTFLSTLTNGLANITAAMKREPGMGAKLLRSRPTALHVNREDLESELKESLHYVFDALLPFLTLFYKDYYPRPNSESGASTSGAASTATSRVNMDEAGVEGPEQMISRDLLDGLRNFAETVGKSLQSRTQAKDLRRCLGALASALGSEADVPDCLHQAPQRDGDPHLAYAEYYREEQELNQALCHFVDNLKALYGGKNSIRAQLGVPIDLAYADLDSDVDALPLGPEYQGLISSFLRPNAASPEQVYAPVAGPISQIRDVFRLAGTSEADKIRHRQLTVANLRILRTLLHNREVVARDEFGTRRRTEVAAAEETLADCQGVLVRMGILDAVLPHLNSDSEAVSDEALGVLSNLLAGGHKAIQDSFMKVFLGAREEPFFACLRQRMARSEEFIREQRSLASGSVPRPPSPATPRPCSCTGADEETTVHHEEEMYHF